MKGMAEKRGFLVHTEKGELHAIPKSHVHQARWNEIKIFLMASGGPSNLKRRRNFVSITALKGQLNREKGIGGQNDTLTQKSKGGANAKDLNTRSQPTLSKLVPQSSEIPEVETSPMPSVESIQHASSEDAAATTAVGSKKNTRDKTVGKGLLRYFNTNGKIKINVDASVGRPINADESAKFATQIGLVMRDVIPVPKKWKDVDEGNGLSPGFDHLQMHMDVNMDKQGVKRSVIQRMKITSRKKRYYLHQHFLKYATLEEAKNNKPEFGPDAENWKELCDHFTSPEFKHRSEVNQKNRQKLKCKHVVGRKAFTVRSHEISRTELQGEPCGRIHLYEDTHSTKKHGWKSNEAKANWEMMIKKKDEYIELGIEKTEEEIVLEVLGHGSGYRKGIGYGPPPPSKRSSLYDTSSEYKDELEETIEELQESKAKVEELQTQVTDLKDELAAQNANFTAQLSKQGAALDKLMAMFNDEEME